MSGAQDARWMDHALELARRGLGNTWPNPSVGCVLVRDGREIGAGWTQPGGTPHAETMALAAAGDAAGATAYVTLEPCAHHGRTPPCAEALARAGIVRAMVALVDPDPRVSGAGLEILASAGIEVDAGLREAEAREVNKGFLTRVQEGRPWVTLKLASTLDGRIALASGVSRWITGPEARHFVHALRATHDAVLIGAGTARADDPALDVREGIEVPRQPVRIVADPGLSLSLTGRLAQSAGQQPLWLMHAAHGVDPGRAHILRDLGAELLPLPLEEHGGLDLVNGLRLLGERGLSRLLCEGGGRLAAGLMRAGLVDELVLVTAGKVIGAEGVPNVGNLDAHDLDAVPRFVPVETRLLGQDVMTRWLSAARAGQNA